MSNPLTDDIALPTFPKEHTQTERDGRALHSVAAITVVPWVQPKPGCHAHLVRPSHATIHRLVEECLGDRARLTDSSELRVREFGVVVQYELHFDPSIEPELARQCLDVLWGHTGWIPVDTKKYFVRRGGVQLVPEPHDDRESTLVHVRPHPAAEANAWIITPLEPLEVYRDLKEDIKRYSQLETHDYVSEHDFAAAEVMGLPGCKRSFSFRIPVPYDDEVARAAALAAIHNLIQDAVEVIAHW